MCEIQSYFTREEIFEFRSKFLMVKKKIEENENLN
jgi:hypothetical protein